MYPKQAYECTLNEPTECHATCMEKISSYFQDPNLNEPSKFQINLNMFTSSPLKGEKVCGALKKPVNKPGTDVYGQSFTQSSRASLYTNLGRICCGPPCKCEYIFQYADTNDQARPTLMVPIVSDIKLNVGYECSDELSDCVAYCRKIAFNSLESNDPSYVKKDTTQRTDAFGSLSGYSYSQYICGLIGKELMDDYGFNVYLRYSASAKMPNEFPYREDIHIGRVCCQYVAFAQQWLAVNRCYQAPPGLRK